MGKKRRRRKREPPERLQVELLDDAGDAVSDDEASPPTAAEVSVEESAEARPAPRGTGDRWAKAVGQAKAPRRTAPSETVEEAGTTGDAARATSHDHSAAAGVRPAGEPLARARELVQQGRVHEAIQLYLGILTVNPSNLKAHNNLGVLLDELKQFEAALEHFRAAEGLAPENVEVLANYASTLTSLARYEEAEELLRRAQRLSPDDMQARLGIGVLYFRRGLYAQAEVELGWVLGRDDGNGPGHYYRGEALNRLGRFDEAAAELQRAVELIPDDPRPYYTLGHLYDRRHQPEEAAEMYRHARRLQVR